MLLKQDRTGLEKKFYDLAERVVTECGLDLYDLDYIRTNTLLRVFVMNKDTKSAVLDDCIKVDHAFTPYFEEGEWIPEDVTLEVSSPGVYRNISTIAHFNLAIDEQIELKLTKSGMDKVATVLSRKVSGKEIKVILKSVFDSYIEVALEDHAVKIELDDVKKANVCPEIGEC